MTCGLLCVMPANLYGSGVNYNPTNSHVLPALIAHFHDNAEANALSVIFLGISSPLRELLHVEDVGKACLFARDYSSPALGELTYPNAGTRVDLSFRELAEPMATATGYQDAIHWDSITTDGTPKKQLDVTGLAALDWLARIPLAARICLTSFWLNGCLAAAVN